MVKIRGTRLDRPGRAGRKAVETAPAIAAQGLVRLQRQVGKDGDQAELRAIFGMDQKVVAADPAQPGQPADLLMGEMRLLFIPIDNLRGGDRQGSGAPILNEISEDEGSAVEEEVELAIMMKVERSRVVFDIVKNGPEHPPPQPYAPGEGIAEFFLEPEFRTDFRDIGDTEEVEPDVTGELSQRLFVFRPSSHKLILTSRRLGCQRRLTRFLD